jgi:hypothetical protein
VGFGVSYVGSLGGGSGKVRSILMARGCMMFTVVFGLYCHVYADSVELGL